MNNADVLHQILSIFTTEYLFKTKDADFDRFQSTWMIPVLEKGVITDVVQDYAKGGNILESLIPISHLFKFKKSELMVFNQNFSIDPFIDFCFPMVISNCLVFIFKLNDNHYFSDYELLMTTIILYLKQEKYNTQIGFLFLSIVKRSYQIYKHAFPDVITLKTIEIIDNYLSIDEFSYDSLVLISQRCYEYNVVDIGNRSMSVICKMIEVFIANQQYFDPSILTKIVEKRLEFFEPVIYSCFGLLSTYESYGSIESLFLYFSTFIYNHFLPTCSTFDPIIEIIPDSTYDKEDNDTISVMDSVSISSLNFDDTFPFEFENADPRSMLGVIHYNSLKLFSLVFSRSKSHYNELFFTYFAIKISEGPCSLLMLRVYIEILKKCKIDVFVSIITFNPLIKSNLFNPSLVVYNQNENFVLVSFLRQEIVNYILNRHPKLLPALLKGFDHCPFLLSEILQRIVKCNVSITEESIEESTIITIVTIDKHLQYLQTKSNSEVHISQARSSILLFMFFLFRNQSLSPSCLNSPILPSYFLSSFFDPSFKELMLFKLREMLTIRGKIDYSSITFIASSLRIIGASPNITANSIIAQDLLSSLITSISINNDIAFLCEPVFHSTLYCLIRYNSAPLMHSLLNLSLQLFIHNDSFELDDETISLMSKTLRNNGKTEFFNSIQSSLFCLLTNSQSVTVNGLSMIKKPSILLLMISIYSSFKMHESHLSFLLDLCKHSIFNSYMMHRGNLDLILIDMIRYYPSNFVFKGCQIDNFVDESLLFKSVLPLLGNIFSVCSSSIVAERVLDVLAPKPSFSMKSKSFLSYLCPLLKQIRDRPLLCFPLGVSEEYLPKIQLLFNDFIQGSTIVFWIRTDSLLCNSLNVKSRIFLIKRGINDYIEVSIHNSIVFVDYIQSDRLLQFRIPGDLIESEWNMISIAYKKINDSQVKFRSRINSFDSFSMKLPIELNQNEPLSLVIGNSTIHSFPRTMLLCLYHICSFSLFSGFLPKESLHYIFINGSHSSISDQTLSLKYHFPVQSNSIINEVPNIIQVFDKTMDCNSIIPVFSKLNGVLPSEAVLVFEFVQICYGRKFYDNLGLVSHFLQQNDHNSLSLPLFQRFYSLIDIDLDKQSMDQLVLCILFNFSIWGKANHNVFNRILSQLSNSLLEFVERISSIPKVIDFILFYLNDQIFINDSEIRLENTTIGSNIQRIILDFWHKEQSNDVFICLLTALSRSMRDSLSSFILSILSQIIVTFCPNLNTIMLMCGIDVNKNPGYILFALQVIEKHYPEISYTFSIQFLIQLKDPTILDNILDFQMNLIPFFPLLLVSSAYNDDMRQEFVINTFECNSYCEGIIDSIKSKSFWHFWFLFFAVHSQPQLHQRICKLIVDFLLHNYDPNEVYSLMVILDIFENSTNLPAVRIKCIIIGLLCDYGYAHDRVTSLVSYCFICLFIRYSYNIHTIQLMRQFQDSMFRDNIDDYNPPVKNDKISSVKVFLNQIGKKGNYRLYLFDVNKMGPGQYAISQKLSELLLKAPHYTPLIRVIKLISRYPSANVRKKSLILRVVSEREFFTIFLFLSDYFAQMGSITSSLQSMFTQNDGIIKSNAQKLVDLTKFSEKGFYGYFSSIQTDYRYQIINHFHSNSIWSADLLSKNQLRKDTSMFYYMNTSILKRNVVVMHKSWIPSFIIPSNIIASFNCVRITIANIQKNSFLISRNSCYLLSDSKIKRIDYSNIFKIVNHIRANQLTAIEIYRKNEASILLDFFPIKSSIVLGHFKDTEMNLNNIQFDIACDVDESTGIFDQWVNNKITNFQLLLYINMCSSRSFNDIVSYPIFPFLSIFDGKEWIRRDFSLPLAVQISESRNIIEKKIIDSSFVFEENFIYNMSPVPPPYIYGCLHKLSPYSNPSISFEFYFKSMEQLSHHTLKEFRNRELIPEFFSVPEAFFHFTESAESETVHRIVTMVYENRKMLESDYVSEGISKWIDLIWGVNRVGQEASRHFNLYAPYLYPENNSVERELSLNMFSSLGVLPPQVFKKPFPNKKPSIYESYNSTWYIFPKKTFETCFLTFEKETHKCLLYFFENGYLNCLNLDLISNEYNRLPMHHNVQENNKFIISADDGLIAIDTLLLSMHFICPNSMVSNQMPVHGIQYAKAQKNVLVVGTKDGVFKIFKYPKLESSTKTINIFNDITTAFDFSVRHGVFACATSDGKISTYSLNKCRFIKSSFINDSSVTHLIISSFGLILCKTKSHIHIFTLNGFFVKKVEFKYEIGAYCSFSTAKGIDYIAFSDKIGGLRIFEAFYPENIDFIKSLGSKVLSIAYSQDLNQLVAINKETKIALVSIQGR